MRVVKFKLVKNGKFLCFAEMTEGVLRYSTDNKNWRTWIENLPRLKLGKGVVQYQFTGFLDKNDKEIWDGSKTDTGIVIWHKDRGAWVLQTIDEDGNEVFVQIGSTVANCLEVIGDIYSTPVEEK